MLGDDSSVRLCPAYVRQRDDVSRLLGASGFTPPACPGDTARARASPPGAPARGPRRPGLAARGRAPPAALLPPPPRGHRRTTHRGSRIHAMPLAAVGLNHTCATPWRVLKTLLSQLRWAREEVRARLLSLWPRRSQGALLALLHGSPCVLYTGPETYVAVTIFRAASSAPPSSPVVVTLIKPHWLACVNWPCLGREQRWDVTPATEFGRAPLLTLVPPTPASTSRQSASTTTSANTRRRSSGASSARPPRSPKALRRVAPPNSLSSETWPDRTVPARGTRDTDTALSLTATSMPRILPRTSFPSEELALYESQSRHFAREWNLGHRSNVVPIATHIVRIPTNAGDGYFYIDLFSSGESVTTRTIRVWSFTLPLGVPASAPLLLLVPETLLWAAGTAVQSVACVVSIVPHLALGIIARVLQLVLPRLTGQHVPLPPPARKRQPSSAGSMRVALDLASIGVRRPLVGQVDEQLGRGGVTYWR